jgi:putative endonuclease
MTAGPKKGKPKRKPKLAAKSGRKHGDCYVYVLGSTGKGGPRTYIGWTNDLDRRVSRHNTGKGARSTRGRAWLLLYAEKLATRVDAMRREWRLKRDRRFRKLLLGILSD